ncbi:unnamed protein product [Calicophoron daubneyi]|uniref:non-specific serine/threonine protein kinase n=1 Tax=Calicophoron daubneyi TaxID=300641 RepID=A0AAV2TUT8_CALDB
MYLPLFNAFLLRACLLFVSFDLLAGGFGMVFRVRSNQGQNFALKRTCVNNEQDLSVCKREITIVSSLSHKNILRYVDSKIGRIEQGIYEVLLLTVHYPGSLSKLLNERKSHQQRLTEVEVLRVFCDLCEAVCRLHHCKTPIIHRDLKVENILIDERQNFVLCDFGSSTSRVLHPAIHGLQRCQEEINKYTTLAYRAPELINLYSSIPLGPQIDIWAMGCLLYCLCFASLPFGDSALAIQSGNYSIPDASPYSDRLHKLIGYLLCVDGMQRPDIFQTCALAFSLASRPNPAQNLNNLPVPHWQDLTTPLRESQQKAARLRLEPQDLQPAQPSSPRSSPAMVRKAETEGCNTSVAPRQRPRAAHQHIIPALQPGSIHQQPSLSTSFISSGSVQGSVLKPPPPALSRSTVQTNEVRATAPPRAAAAQTSSANENNSSTNILMSAPGEPAVTVVTNAFVEAPWKAEFPVQSKNNSNPSTIPFEESSFAAPSLVTQHFCPRGHQRTWSADVGYMNRCRAGLPTAFSPQIYPGPISSFQTNSQNQAFASSSWEPFSPQLRQVQSLVSLSNTPAHSERITSPSQFLSRGDNVTTNKPVPTTRFAHESPTHPSGTSSIPQQRICSPFGLIQISQTDLSHSNPSVDLRSLNYGTEVDEDLLFGAAFDAIRENPKHKCS